MLGKKCSMCGKSIRHYNQSGFCFICYRKSDRYNEIRKKYLKEYNRKKKLEKANKQ